MEETLDIEEELRRYALHFAAGDGDLELVQTLIAFGHDLQAFDEMSWTPLHQAVSNRKHRVVEYLLSMGADVNAHEEEKIGETPLGNVAENCSYQMAKTLIDAGAYPTIPGWMMLTALDRAKERKKHEGKRAYKLLQETASKPRQRPKSKRSQKRKKSSDT